MSPPPLPLQAHFNPKVKTYWLLGGAIIMVCCVVTIPLIPFWFIFGRYFTGKYLDRMQCTLTEKSLVVKKGFFVRVEKTIPLEKITDLAIKQGPVMRMFELHALSVETAGSSGAGPAGALVQLVGITDSIAFRDTVLAQRDRLVSGTMPAPSTSSHQDDHVLEDIRDTLHRIEQTMNSDR